MQDERAARQRAITLRLAGRPTHAIGAAVGCSEVWLGKGWGRSREAGPEGLYDPTRANHHVAQRIPRELERAILSVRRRLRSYGTPATRYCLIGATAILAELKGLGVRPRLGERTVERVLGRNAAGGGHRTRTSDGVPERPGAEALALHAAERLTDIEPRSRCRFPPTVRAVMR